jgi:hypothetical protein
MQEFDLTDLPTVEKFKKKMFVLIVVKVYDMEGKEIRSVIRDFAKRKTQEWLTSLIMWASHEKYSVVIARKVQ